MSAVFGAAVFFLALVIAGRTFKFIKLLINKLFDWGESKIL